MRIPLGAGRGEAARSSFVFTLFPIRFKNERMTCHA